jgi:hypothetical protein
MAMEAEVSKYNTEKYASAHIILDSKTFLGYEWLMDNYETLTLCVYVSNFHCHS